MRVIQFQLPVAQAESITVNEDVLPFFYGHVHRHKEMQLTLILKGEGTLIVGNYAQAFKPGDLYIIGANQPHIFKSDESNYKSVAVGNVHAIHIFFEHESTLQNLIHLPEMEFVKKFIQKTDHGLQVPDELTHEAAKKFMKLSQSSGLKRLLLFIKLIQFLTKNVNSFKPLSTTIANTQAAEPTDARMDKVYRYTFEHFAEDITLEKIASVVHITPQAFCKYFKMHTRKTYKVFLNEVRINEACRKIINGDYECISSVAYATGFKSPINFNKVFKKTTGKSPSEYIREYRSEWGSAVNLLRQPA